MLEIEYPPPPAPEPARPTFELKETLEVASKAILTLVGLCYALGLVVRNIYLSRFGYYTVGLLEINYILTGLWALLPPILGSLSLNVFLTLYKNNSNEDKTKRRRGRWLIARDLGVAAYATAFLVYVSYRFTGLPLNWRWVLVTALGVVTLVFVVSSAYLFMHPEKLDINLRLFSATLALAVFGFYLSQFAAKLYSEIPSGVGGGRSVLARLVTAQDSRPHLLASGIQFAGEATVSEPTEMLLATGDEYILRAQPSGHVVVVPRDAVKALIFAAR